MKQRFLHIFLCFLQVIACTGLVSCVYDEYSDEPDDGTAVMFVLRANVLDGEHTGDIEAMHSLRVVILHEDGSVEHNFHVDNLNGIYEYTRLFQVTRNETKKIYLIANEASIGSDLNWDHLGENGTPASQTLESCTFDATPDPETGNPQFSAGIPMSACYHLAVGNETRIEQTFYVVRAATKFTFSFENGRTDNVTVKNMTVSAFADKSYLMPRLHDESDNTISSEKFTVNNTGMYDASSNRFWIDWLKNAAAESEKGVLSPDKIGWISQYKIPDGASYENNDITIGSAEDNHITLHPGDTYEYPRAFYRCESSYMLTEDATEQYYKIDRLTVKASSEETDREWVWQSSDTDSKLKLKLSQVKYLFRNTHVRINVVFGMKETVIFARVYPWVALPPSPPSPFEPETE